MCLHKIGECLTYCKGATCTFSATKNTKTIRTSCQSVDHTTHRFRINVTLSHSLTLFSIFLSHSVCEYLSLYSAIKHLVFVQFRYVAEPRMQFSWLLCIHRSVCQYPMPFLWRFTPKKHTQNCICIWWSKEEK